MFFKNNIKKLNRIQTSLNRDIEKGIVLDRNERVTHFPSKMIKDLYSQFTASKQYVYGTLKSLLGKNIFSHIRTPSPAPGAGS